MGGSQYTGTSRVRPFYSNGHVLKFGPPPKRWRTDKTVTLSCVERLISGPFVRIEPVAFGTLYNGVRKGTDAVLFDNGTIIDGRYFDLFAHLASAWKVVNRSDTDLPIVIKGKDPRPLGVVMPINAGTPVQWNDSRA